MAKVLKNLLTSYGYNLVALPKEDIAPLLLLYKNEDSLGSLDGTLDNFFYIGDKEMPELILNKTVSGIEGSTVITYDAEGGLSILDNLLARMKMGKLGGKLKLDSNDTITIKYEDPKEDKVSLLALDNYISTSNPSKKKFTTYQEKLEKSELYVVNAVLKSNSFSITVQDSNGQELDVEATIKGLLDANTNLSRNKKNFMTLTNPTGTPLVFAFKAQQIIYEPTAWWQFFTKEKGKFRIKDQQGEILKGESDFPTRRLELNEPVDL